MFSARKATLRAPKWFAGHANDAIAAMFAHDVTNDQNSSPSR